MKKILIVLFVFLSVYGFSQQLMAFGGGLGFTTINLVDGAQKGSIGLTTANFSMTSLSSQNFGFITDASFGYVLKGEITYLGKTTEINLENYNMRFVIDAIFGLGGIVPIQPALNLLLGGGLHYSAVFITPMSSDYDDYDYEYFPSYLYNDLGIGVTCYLLIPVMEKVSIKAGFYAAADFFSPVDLLIEEGSTGFSNSLSFYPSVKIAIKL